MVDFLRSRCSLLTCAAAAAAAIVSSNWLLLIQMLRLQKLPYFFSWLCTFRLRSW
jgi:hypothetical protein